MTHPTLSHSLRRLKISRIFLPVCLSFQLKREIFSLWATGRIKFMKVFISIQDERDSLFLIPILTSYIFISQGWFQTVTQTLLLLHSLYVNQVRAKVYDYIYSYSNRFMAPELTQRGFVMMMCCIHCFLEAILLCQSFIPPSSLHNYTYTYPSLLNEEECV